jgi:pyridoxine 4-dehydrogenase
VPTGPSDVVFLLARSKSLRTSRVTYLQSHVNCLFNKRGSPKEGDFRRNLSRFQEENLKHNFAIVDALTEIATRKRLSPAQLSIAWVSARGPHVVPLPGSSNAKRTLENIAGGEVELSSEDLSEIDRVLSSHAVKGGRYVDTVPDEKLHLWG